MRTIAIHTSKGGVGKTTLSVNLAYEIARLGNKVLIIDLDDQGNSSLYLGVNQADDLDKAKTLDEFNRILEEFKNRKEIIDFISADIYSKNFQYKDYIQEISPFNNYLNSSTSNVRIDVIPSSYRTTEEIDRLTSRVGRMGNVAMLLKKALKKFDNEYDYVILDTSPNITPATLNGLYAARYLIIPTQLEYFSVYGVSSVVREIERGVHEEMGGQQARVLGILPMMTEPLRGQGKASASKIKINNFAKQLLERAQLGTKLLPEIKRTKSFSDASEKRLPLRVFVEQKSESKRTNSEKEAVEQLSNLTEEIINRIDQDESRRGN
ncbi:ParA family protein [Nostoc sp.]|uniref:ParA family protein n=1 Tax=Nostoc sp. TaxID=1180 RepID=UPI002FF5E193